eukprot:272520-Pleurochrysis_carterae.AAC.1
MRAEEASRELQKQVLEGLQQKLSARSQKAATERQELSNGHFRCKTYAEKVKGYQVKSNHKIFDVEPMAEEVEELKAENQGMRDEISELKGITEPGKEYFHRDDGFTLVVDFITIAKAITMAHVSHNQVRPSS